MKVSLLFWCYLEWHDEYNLICEFIRAFKYFENVDKLQWKFTHINLLFVDIQFFGIAEKRERGKKQNC